MNCKQTKCILTPHAPAPLTAAGACGTFSAAVFGFPATAGCHLVTLASTSRADRIRYSWPEYLTSVPPYFE